jgi:hypothetical protein
MESGGRFCVGAFGRNLTQEGYKICTLNASCKENDFQHKNVYSRQL